MILRLGKKYRGYWESKSNPVSVRFNEKLWKVVSASDEPGSLFFSIFQKSDGSTFYITSEELNGVSVDGEIVEEAVFAKMFNADNDASMAYRFTDVVCDLSFDFVRYRFVNKKFGSQMANYGFGVFGDNLMIIGLAWPEALEIPQGSHWPVKHQALISGVGLDYSA